MTPGAYDVTSNSSSEEDNIKTKKKKRINIPEKLHSVYKTVELPLKSLRSERIKNDEKGKKTTSENNKDCVDVDSDDSIGSASDLKADEDRTEVPVKEDTISESIRTCGSSAYHAECESMATREEEYFKKPRHQPKKKVEIDQTQTEDIMFVGHHYGQKPLLMDDELDSDCESKFQKWNQSPEKCDKSDNWFQMSSSVDENKDVFALAPFENPRPKPKIIKTKTGEQQNVVLVDINHTPQEAITESFATFPPYNGNEEIKIRETPSSLSLNPFLTDDVTNVPISIPISEPIVIDSRSLKQMNKESKFRGEFSSHEFPCNFPETNRDSIYNESKYYSGEIRSNRQVDHSLPDLYAENVLPGFTKENSNHFEHSEKNQKSKKDKKRDKYQLIDDLSSDKSEGSMAKPVKVSRQTHSSKKVSTKIKKSSLKIKVDGGFSNMSFEDFPVDERNVIESSIMPYEVLRSPQQEEKKFGSKRIGNPFS